MGLIATVTAAALAGLVGSPHCVGMCGGLAVAAGGTLNKGVAWTAGRLATYAILGATAGTFGSLLGGLAGVGSVVAGLLLIWFAASLAGLPVPKPTAIPGLTKAMAWVSRGDRAVNALLFGSLTGLLPCGLVYSALALPVAAGDPLTGGLAMVAFGLGTVPALALTMTGARRVLARSLASRRILAFAVLVVGLVSIGQRAELPTFSADRAAAAEDPACH